MKSNNPNNLKRRILAGTAVALGSLGVAKAGVTIADSVDRVYGNSEPVAIVPVDSEHKDITMGGTYPLPDGTRIKVTTPWDAARVANVPGVTVSDESDMLDRELTQEGINPDAPEGIPVGTILRVQPNSTLSSPDVTSYHPE